MVPQWYLEAFLKGASPERRRELVRQAVLKEKQALAAGRGEAIAQQVDENIVSLTCEMYELSLKAGRDGT